MSNVNFQSKSLLSRDTESGQVETISLVPSEVWYSDKIILTHMDSVYGVHYRIEGTRSGGNVTCQWQQSMEPGDSTSWSDIGSSFLFGSGGVYPALVAATVDSALYPSAATTLKPFLRLKVTAAAVTAANIQYFRITTRGLR